MRRLLLISFQKIVKYIKMFRSNSSSAQSSDTNNVEFISAIENSHEELTKTGHHFEKSKLENFEISVFVERLITIFERLMSQLEFAATLPLYLSRPEVLENLEKSDLKQVVAAFLPFSAFQPRDQNAITNNESFTDEEEAEGSKTTSDPTFSRTVCSSKSQTPGTYSSIRTALEILQSYELVRDLAKSSVAEIPKCTVNFLRQLVFFLEHVVAKTKLTPQEERDEELFLNKLKADMKATRNRISDLQDTLEDQKTRHGNEAVQLTKEINDLMDKWKKIISDFNLTVSEIMAESEQNMAESLAQSNKKIEELQTELNTLKDKIKMEQDANQIKLAAFAGKKIKVESQLVSLIMKYDTDSVEKQAEFDEVMVEFRAIDDERAQLMEDMEQQKILYDKIIGDREAEQREMFEKMFTHFVTHRSARVIQRWWRAILRAQGFLTKKKKGEKGKGKGKKK